MKLLTSLATFTICLFLVSCSGPSLNLRQEAVTPKSLASIKIGTPDYRKSCCDVGQALHIDWRLPKCASLDSSCLRLKVIYCNNTYDIFLIRLCEREGEMIYELAGDELKEKGGLLAYRAELLGPASIYSCWEHQLWVEPQDMKPTVRRSFPTQTLLK